uniref:Uncharacterized protein n=1 Tax=Thermosporothrix sp. COM3 TaxID=2490863 RepID=A0A455SS12_9CHLR|nr:hypothetical protein KTC_59540 [Thermosporothrix sp. COM3]
MPNRYEREIEEILRNLEHSDAETGAQRTPAYRSRKRFDSYASKQSRPHFNLRLSKTDWLLLIGILCALIGGGFAYARPHDYADLYTGIFATIATLCIFLVAFSHFLFRPHRPRSYRYGNVTITPLRRGPFDQIRTQWNLLMLKLRYRRKKK